METSQRPVTPGEPAPDDTYHAAAELRFWRNVVRGDGCWEFAPHRKGNGYRRFRVGIPDKFVGAHVYSFILHNGPVPSGLQVNHTCDNPKCVRPDHLYAGTARQNTADMIERGRSRLINAKRSVCKNGHLMTDSNIYVRPSRPNVNECRSCIQASVAKRKDKN